MGLVRNPGTGAKERGVTQHRPTGARPAYLNGATERPGQVPPSAPFACTSPFFAAAPRQFGNVAWNWPSMKQIKTLQVLRLTARFLLRLPSAMPCLKSESKRERERERERHRSHSHTNTLCLSVTPPLFNSISSPPSLSLSLSVSLSLPPSSTSSPPLPLCLSAPPAPGGTN